MPRYTDGEIDDAVREVARTLERVPTAEEYRENREVEMPTARTVINRRESWLEAIDHAGLEIDPTRHVGHRQYDRRDDINSIRIAICELGKRPSKSEYDDLGLLPHSGTISERWQDDGGWRGATETAFDRLSAGARTLLEEGPREIDGRLRSQVDPIHRTQIGRHGRLSWLPCHSDEEIVAGAVETFPDLLEQTPREALHAFNSVDLGRGAAASVLADRFGDDWEGSFSGGPGGHQPHEYTRDVLLDALEQAADGEGNLPTWEQAKSLDMPSPQTYWRKFGSLEAAKERVRERQSADE